MYRSLLLLATLLSFPFGASAAVTLRSLGAAGDGQTDDRAALEAALNQQTGQEIDGEGLTYAVRGTVCIRTGLKLRNLTLQQTAESFDTSPFILSSGSTEVPQVTPPEALTRMVDGLPWLRHDGIAVYPEDPVVTGADREALRRMLNTRTLFVLGTEEKPVPVQLENVKVLRGNRADAGMHSNSAGLFLVHASPLILKNVEISGSGKGSGLIIDQCRQVKLDRVHIHDILWAPYRGDVDFGEAALSKFGWNNSPIYDFSESSGGRFIRVRVQEQVTGLTLNRSEDVEIIRCRIERIGTTVEGRFLPWQADGMTVSAVRGLVMRDCDFSQCWEGIDFTGRGVDGFLQEDIRIRDTFAYGFKYAHPQKNGRVVRCLSERAGYRAFTIGSEAENIAFVACIARETGVDSRWRVPGRPINGIAGFELGFDGDHSPRNITLSDCLAENRAFPNQMDFGFTTSDRARNPALGIRLIRPRVEGAKVRPVDGFLPE